MRASSVLMREGVLGALLTLQLRCEGRSRQKKVLFSVGLICREEETILHTLNNYYSCNRQFYIVLAVLVAIHACIDHYWVL